MPGIDRSRVVGKDEEELNEFTCDICLNIFDDPVVTQCCRKPFCTLCINQWLIDNNTCPNDRKRLTVRQLTPVSRMVTNLLNNLKIKCENYGNGCQSIVRFEEMANHLKTCNTCNSLKKSLSDKQKTIETLKSENEKLKRDLDQSRIEMNKSRTNSISLESEVEAINNARSISTPIVELNNNLSEEEMDYLTNLAKSALLKRTRFFDVSNYIYENIRDNQGYNRSFWSIKTDLKDRKTLLSPYNKLLRLTFNSLTIVIIGLPNSTMVN